MPKLSKSLVSTGLAETLKSSRARRRSGIPTNLHFSHTHHSRKQQSPRLTVPCLKMLLVHYLIGRIKWPTKLNQWQSKRSPNAVIEIQMPANLLDHFFQTTQATNHARRATSQMRVKSGESSKPTNSPEFRGRVVNRCQP